MKQSITTIILSTVCKCLHFLFLPFLDGYVNRRTIYAFPYKINDDIQYLLTVCPMTSSKLRHSRGAVYSFIQYLDWTINSLGEEELGWERDKNYDNGFSCIWVCDVTPIMHHEPQYTGNGKMPLFQVTQHLNQ